MSEEKQFINVQVDSQILSAFMACPRQMEYKYVRHLKSLEGTKSAFSEGTLVHEGMKGFYLAKKDNLPHKDCVDVGMAFARKLAPTLDNIEPDMVLTIYKALQEYFDFRQADNFKVLAVEQAFRFIAYEEYPIRVILTGRIDLIIQDLNSKLIIPIDHKKEVRARFYSSTSNQFKIYCLATNANTLIVNRFGMQKSLKADVKFKRDNLTFDADVLKEFKETVLPYYAKQYLDCQDENYYPPNYSSCAGDFACQFSDKYNGGICTVSREVRETKLLQYFRPDTAWDPNDD